MSRRCPKLGKIVSGMFTPVPAKHSKSFSLVDAISVGMDRMHLQAQIGPRIWLLTEGWSVRVVPEEPNFSLF
jgi:hypothetical protein